MRRGLKRPTCFSRLEFGFSSTAREVQSLSPAAAALRAIGPLHPTPDCSCSRSWKTQVLLQGVEQPGWLSPVETMRNGSCYVIFPREVGRSHVLPTASGNAESDAGPDALLHPLCFSTSG